MDLIIETDGGMRVTYPLDKGLWVTFPPDGRKKDRRFAKGVIKTEFVETPVKIVTVADDAFDLIRFSPLPCIAVPQVGIMRLAALRGFEVDDAMYAQRNIVKRQRTVCFKKDGVAF